MHIISYVHIQMHNNGHLQIKHLIAIIFRSHRLAMHRRFSSLGTHMGAEMFNKFRSLDWLFFYLEFWVMEYLYA